MLKRCGWATVRLGTVEAYKSWIGTELRDGRHLQTQDGNKIPNMGCANYHLVRLDIFGQAHGLVPLLFNVLDRATLNLETMKDYKFLGGQGIILKRLTKKKASDIIFCLIAS